MELRSILKQAWQASRNAKLEFPLGRPSSDGGRTGLAWLPVAVGLALAIVATVLFLVGCSESGTAARMEGAPQAAPTTGVGLSAFQSDSFVEPDASPTNVLVDRVDEDVPDDDPGSDGWSTEVFHSAVKEQLKAFGKLLEDPEKLDLEHLAPFAIDEVLTSSLRPESVTTVYDDPRATVIRWNGPSPSQAESAVSGNLLQGQVELLRNLQSFASLSEEYQEARVEFKVFRINADGEPSVTAFVEWSCRGDESSLQRNATWEFTWKLPEEGSEPLIAGIKLLKYEEVSCRADNGVWFSDCTQAVLGGSESFNRQLSRGEPFWKDRIQSSVHATFLGIHGGLALGDVNGDGLDDVYVCQPGGLPNRLYLHQQDGTLKDISRAAQVDWIDYTSSALILDLDNDGDQDLAVLTLHGVVLMENNGSARFVGRSTITSPNKPTALSASDFDHDGDLDLYIVCYGPNSLDSTGDELRKPAEFMSPVPYDDANNGSPNSLFRNDGSLVFTDVTKETGLDSKNHRWSYAAGWEDFDNDGDADLYVANDFGRNCLYRNDDGSFVEVASEAGVEDIASGMSVSWGDYNNDGLMDLYVGNMFSAAGGRITYQRSFKTGISESRAAQFQRMARGNSLFENQGDGTFLDVSEQAAVTMGRWAWSSRFGDVNNDGREDIVVANGFITNQNTHDL